MVLTKRRYVITTVPCVISLKSLDFMYFVEEVWNHTGIGVTVPKIYLNLNKTFIIGSMLVEPDKITTLHNFIDQRHVRRHVNNSGKNRQSMYYNVG